MAVLPQNILQTVQTYQRSNLGLLLNLCCLVATANTEFKEFNNINANLGSVVTFDKPPRAIFTAGLVATNQSADQRVQSLACDQSGNITFNVTAQQRIFNLEKDTDNYLRVFGKTAIATLGNAIERNIGLNFISGVVSTTTGLVYNDSGPYRFYGNGATPISSFGQLATANMLFKNYGSVADGMKVYLPDTIVPSIISSGLNQFATIRNDEMADSWVVGQFGSPPVQYYQSNQLPFKISGNTGVDGDVLTVISTNDPTGKNVTQITVSGATGLSGNDPQAVFQGDSFEFKDGVSGQPDMRYLTWIGDGQSANPVQFRATANAGSTAGVVVLNIYPGLNWAGGHEKNLNNPIAAGMQILTFPSSRRGCIVGGDSFYIALPQLPPQDPFASASEFDPTTKVSVRLSYGSVIGQNQTLLIHDAVWGSTLVPEYCMGIMVPLSQG